MAKFFSKTILVFIALFSLCPLAAFAANLSFSPSSGSYNVGSTFSVSVYTSSTDQAMNAASGVISFPADKLEVTSVSKTGSIFSLWVQDPSFSNDAGTVTFEGIVLNPGFTGGSGKIVTVTFRVKAAGSADLSFSSGSVLANDGSGTNILSGLGTADFDLVSSEQTVTPKVPQPESNNSGLPIAPEIVSSTHPDPTKWYQNPNPDLSWCLPSDVTAVQVLLGTKSDSVPTVLYSPPISEKKLDSVSDGAWYFSVRFRNAAGFGDTTHFGLNIDTEKPETFDITQVSDSDTTSPKVSFIFNATDKTSGIDHYEINMDGKDADNWTDDGSHVYKTDLLAPGHHIMIAKAVDKAGNSRSNSVEFTVDPLTAPVIDDYPAQLQVGDPMTIDGHTDYKSATVTLYLALGKATPDTYTVKTDDAGKFTFTMDKKIKSGLYTLWAITTDSRGATSQPSDKVTININSSSLLVIGSFVVNVLTILVPLIALLILLVLLLLWSWHRFILMRERLRRDIRNVESGLHKAFNLLRDDVREQIRALEKVRARRKLTEEEEKIIDRFKKNLDDVEEFVDKEMKDIKDEVK